MRRRAAVSLMLAGIAAAPAVAVASGPHAGSGLRITVRPPGGVTTTHFQLSFRTPVRTGRVGVFDRQDQLTVHGPSGQAGCVSEVFRQLPAAAAHARVVTTLDPAPLGGKWCVGTYHGRIDELDGPACVKGQPCPEFASRLRTLGRFSFRVKSAPSGGTPSGGTPSGGTPSGGTPPGDTAPPMFAGLQSAFACTPGPQRPGQTTPFTLTWTAASDNVTPSSLIVYDVFMATTTGGEDFSHPSWSTTPGVTQFKTPGLASHGTFYFVVRARDQAGNEDHNLVERRGIDPCV